MVRYLSLASLLVVCMLSVPAVNAQGGKVSIKKVEDAIEFRVGDELVTRLLIGADRPKPIFWPLNAPGGVPLTRSWPMKDAQPGEATDHPHQQSAWFCHGDVVPEGIELKAKVKGIAGVDFWSINKGAGKIVNGSFSVAAGDTSGIGIGNDWKTADGTVIMQEEQKIRLHDFGKARLIVVNITLIATKCPITFADTKEGCFGIRINDEINAMAKGKGKIQNAEGVVAEKLAREADNKTWGVYSDWCDYSGPIGGKVVGLTIMVDPKNSHRSAWHVRGYGLMAANPFGRDKHARFPAVKGNNELVKLKKDEHLQLRYGMLLHEGDAVSGDVAAHFKTFVALRGKD